MNKHFLSAIIGILLSIIGVSAMAHSADALTNDITFIKDSTVHLTRYNNRLYSFRADATGGLEVFRRRKNSPIWKKISNNPFHKDITSNLTEVYKFRVVGKKIYVAGRSNGVVQIWSKCKLCAKPWKQVGEDGLGDINNTSFSDMLKINGRLFVIVTNSEDGLSYIYRKKLLKDEWDQIGTAGLDHDLIMGDAGKTKWAGDGYVLAAGNIESPSLTTTDIYRASFDDLTTWEKTADVTEIPGTDITGDDGSLPNVGLIHGRFVVVHDASYTPGHPVEIYSSNDGETFTLLGQKGLTDDNLENNVSYLRIVDGELYAAGTQEMPTIYHYNTTTDSWEVAYATEFDTNISDYNSGSGAPLPFRFVKYKGTFYGSMYFTKNDNGHSKVFRFNSLSN
ncbi:MAG: hypothetical protein Q8P90_06220 [bacterium]|nr:hypothetical protein [bacterium]